MEKHIYDEKNGLGYTLYGDYYLPDLELPEDEEAHYGKYGMLRKTYLKEHRKAYYQMMILQGKLNEHLNRVDREAHERMEILVAQIAEKQGVSERMKMQNQLKWVALSDNIRASAEEIVLKDIVYL